MNRFLMMLAMIVLAGCAAVPRPASAPAAAGPPPYDAWARVLEKYVDAQGRVDFAGVARNRTELDRFVAYVYDVGPNNHPERFPTSDHVLAFHLNAYNALALHNVIEAGIPSTLDGVRKVNFFYLRKVRVGGEAISLYDYENQVIRALGDARVHLALNCMSVGCPRLPREPFLGERLGEQLDRESTFFFNEVRNVQVDDTRRLVKFSEILRFYTADFLASAPSLAVFVNRYRASTVPEAYAVDFLVYDWTINRQPTP